jgi:hypothetical protein
MAWLVVRKIRGSKVNSDENETGILNDGLRNKMPPKLREGCQCPLLHFAAKRT